VTLASLRGSSNISSTATAIAAVTTNDATPLADLRRLVIGAHQVGRAFGPPFLLSEL
jgi:hypothetical protein